MIKKLKITVLSDNLVSSSWLIPEHGLSFFFECDGKSYLFDTGVKRAFILNSRSLGVDLSSVFSVILSHGHYDHVGGLGFLENKQVFIHNDFFVPKYKKVNDKFIYLGAPHSEQYYVEANNLEFIKLNEDYSLSKNIKLIFGFPYSGVVDYFFVKNEEQMQPDFFNDELVVVIDTLQGLVVLTGCSHCGISNVLDRCIASHPGKKIFALLGGFHLSKLTEEVNQNVAELINKYAISNIGISHCTGEKLAKYLINSNVFNFNVGDSFKV